LFNVFLNQINNIGGLEDECSECAIPEEYSEIPFHSTTFFFIKIRVSLKFKKKKYFTSSTFPSDNG